MDEQRTEQPAPLWLAVVIFIGAPVWGLYAVIVGKVSDTQPTWLDKIIFVILSPGLWVAYQVMLYQEKKIRFIPATSILVSIFWVATMREIVRLFLA
jgi:hypothetical protein